MKFPKLINLIQKESKKSFSANKVKSSDSSVHFDKLKTALTISPRPAIDILLMIQTVFIHTVCYMQYIECDVYRIKFMNPDVILNVTVLD